MIVYLNVKVDSDNTLFGQVIGKHGLGDRNDNGGRFVDFCNFHLLVIGGTMFELEVAKRQLGFTTPTSYGQSD